MKQDVHRLGNANAIDVLDQSEYDQWRAATAGMYQIIGSFEQGAELNILVDDVGQTTSMEHPSTIEHIYSMFNGD